MIQIIRGSYGLPTDDGRVIAKNSKDAPFSMSAEKEERLVKLGVAQYITTAKAIESVTEDDGLSSMTLTALRKIAKEYDIDGSTKMKKSDLVKAIQEVEEKPPVFDDEVM